MMQLYPCENGDVQCIESASGYNARFIPIKNCSSEVTNELHQYYKIRNKLIGDFALYAQCYDDEDLYVQGDPFAWTNQASLQIDFKP